MKNKSGRRICNTSSDEGVPSIQLEFSLLKSVSCRQNPLKDVYSDNVNRLCFDIDNDSFLTPASTPKHRRHGLPDPPRRVSDRLVSPPMSCHFCLLNTQLNLISVWCSSHSSSPVASPMPFRRGLAALGLVSGKVMLFLWLFGKK